MKRAELLAKGYEYNEDLQIEVRYDKTVFCRFN